jgi:hypothetical protein
MSASVTDDDDSGNYAIDGLGALPKSHKSHKSHKLLKTPVPTELFYDFIKKISHKLPTSNYYLIDICAYKKATYCEDETPVVPSSSSSSSSLLQKFCNDLLPYYCKDKHFFLTRKMSFNNLNTILRQICRHNSIECKSERKYDKSKTQIVYYIHDKLNANDI